MSIKYDSQTMQLMGMFEELTGAKLKDCFAIADLQVFVVEKGHIGRAVGRKGANVKKLASALKKKIKIIEHADDVAQFARNTVYPIKPADVVVDEQDSIVTIVPPDMLSRGLLIGRQAIKLRETEKIVQRFFTVTELKVSRPPEGVSQEPGTRADGTPGPAAPGSQPSENLTISEPEERAIGVDTPEEAEAPAEQAEAPEAEDAAQDEQAAPSKAEMTEAEEPVDQKDDAPVAGPETEETLEPESEESEAADDESAAEADERKTA